MNLNTFHLGLVLGLGFLLLIPLTLLVKDRRAAQQATVCSDAVVDPAPATRLLEPVQRVFSADRQTRCEQDARCVSFADELLGMRMSDQAGRSEQTLGGHLFACHTRKKPAGGAYVSCRLNTNAVTEDEHNAALADVLDALRDRHGAERSWRITRRTDHSEETWDWGSRKNGDRRLTLRVSARWRYNPRGLGVPNVIKLDWQGVGW